MFTPFIDVGRIVGRMLQDEDIDSLYYFGSMSHAVKHQATKDFTEKESIRVLAALIQCSGQALNLACANRILALDVWWNVSMEQQAFGRVYRMSQKETYFARIMVKNSIDERLVQLQLDKLDMVANTIKDSDSSKTSLSLEEIASLFGRVVRDQSGKIVNIEPDDDDKSEGQEEGENCVSRTHGASSTAAGWNRTTYIDVSGDRDREDP